MKNNSEISWFDEVEDHNYPAAESYLSLIFDHKLVPDLIERLRKEQITTFKARTYSGPLNYPCLV